MYERLTVTDVAKILREAADSAARDLASRSYTHHEDAAAKLLYWLADAAEAVADDDDEARRRMMGERT